MPVECEALHQPKGNKKPFVDLGVKCPIIANIEGETFGYKANSMLADCGFGEANSMASGRVAKLEAHRDEVGCVNIRLAQGEIIPARAINRAVIRPLLSEAETFAI